MPGKSHLPVWHCNEQKIAVIGLPSSLCIAIPRSELTVSVRDLKALTYALEELVPLDAENMSPHVGSELVVVADGRAIQLWLSDEPIDGISCVAAVPLAVLIAQGAVAMSNNSRASSYRLAVVAGNQADILTVGNNELTAWQWTTAEPETLGAVLTSMMSDTSDNFNIVGVSEQPQRARLIASTPAQLEFIDTSSDEFAFAAIASIQSGVAKPLVNFTAGPLAFVDPLAPARSSVRTLAVAALLAVVMLCAGLNWRAVRYRAEASQYVLEQEALFRQLFPKHALPTGVLSRIQSEHRRLSAMKGADTNIPELGSALPTMQAFWKALPTARYSLDVLHFTPETLKNASGLAKSYADLEAVRLGLVEHNFEVPSLSASQNSRGVTLKLESVALTDKSKGKGADGSERRP